MKRMILLVLLFSQLILLGACGGSTAVDETIADTAVTETTVETEPEYVYPETGYDGYDFVMFNADEQFGCSIRFDVPEQTGEMLDDAIFNRNRMIEEKLDVKLSEYQVDGASNWGVSQRDMCLEVQRAVLAGDDLYDAAYLPVFYNASVISDGTLLDLKSIPELQLTEAWWDQVINDELIINNKLYTASGPLNFQTMDLAWVIMFNEGLMTDRGMEFPYDLVREGKWTLDAFGAMVTGVANLNGDDSFTWNPDGNAFYGIANHAESPEPLIYSSGNRLMERDGDTFKLTAGTERMYNTIDKLSAILDKKTGNAFSDNTVTGYIYGFSNNRALFLTAELKGILRLRDADITFGLLPTPKYDEQQEDYMTYVNHICCFLTIPSTSSDTARTGTILDAMTYEGYKTVLSVYYDNTLTHKGLRNENSLEMMNIIRDTRGTQVSNVLDITGTLSATLAHETVLKATGTAASTIAAAEPGIQSALDAMMEAFE